MSQRRTGNNRPRSTATTSPVATIDLHGYTKGHAISLLTDFLERVCKNRVGEVWVEVITGTGAHSRDGPVLRTAVGRLLQKREMIFELSGNKGSFKVQANSGHVLYPKGPPTDTKVLIEEASEGPVRLPTAADRIQPSDYDPLPHEVAYADQAIEESRDMYKQTLKEQKRQEKLLKKALSKSKLEAEQEEQEEQKMITRALSESMAAPIDPPNSIDDSMDEDLRKVLELSKSETRMDCNDELERVLSLSKLEAEKVAHTTTYFSVSTDSQETESSNHDDDLLRVLELSKSEEAVRSLLIEEDVLPLIQRVGSDQIQLIMENSGAVIDVSPAPDLYGMRTVRVTGPRDAVELASGMVIEASLIAKSDRLSGTEQASPKHPDSVTGIDDEIEAPRSSTSEDTVCPLQSFLETQAACFKCSTDEFYHWLLSQDIDCLEALDEACEDDEYVAVMQSHGLKVSLGNPCLLHS